MFSTSLLGELVSSSHNLELHVQFQLPMKNTLKKIYLTSLIAVVIKSLKVTRKMIFQVYIRVIIREGQGINW